MEATQDIYAKLLLVQEKLKPIPKSADNPFFKSKYFDINGLLAEVKPIIQELGVLLLQPIDLIDGKTVVTTILRAPDGSEVKGVMELPVLSDPQKMGSAITYYRRYSLQSLLGLEAEDDDGNAASKSTPKAKGNPYYSPEAKGCPACESINVKTIPAGTSKEGKAYKTFHVCNDCKHKFF